MLKVGLTGGIGCGKTTVGHLFSELGVPTLDADVVARHLVEKGQPALAEIQQTFGAAVLNSDGHLDRKRLKALIFSDPDQKQRLESILHPRVFTELEQQIQRLSDPYCVVIIPLLFETGKKGFVDRILVADCPVNSQIARVRLRDSLTEAEVKAIIASQVSRDFRLEHADDAIDTTLEGSKLAENVKKLHNFYLNIAESWG